MVRHLHRAPLKRGHPSAVAAEAAILRQLPDGSYLAFDCADDAIRHSTAQLADCVKTKH